jgi:hypothetical protein
MTPSIALASCEGALRHLLAYVLERRYGSNWLATVAKPDKLARWREEQGVEDRKRTSRGVAVVSTELLDFAHLYQLIDIAEAQWEYVAPALGSRAATSALLRRFDDLRNTVAHSRDLLPFEEDLLSGIAGEIRNRVTLYMSTQAPSGEHFARIELITDGFGNRIEGAATVQTSNPSIRCAQVLSIGEQVTFRARGWDPHGRDLEWELTVVPDDYAVPLPRAIGNEVELTWTVGPGNVSSQTYVIVRMKSASPYHRWSEGIDGMGLHFYQVIPPSP